MSRAAGAVLRALAGEALRDAFRRRIAPVIAAISLLSLLVVDSCTSCAPTVVQDGTPVSVPDVAGWTGLVIFWVLAQWTAVLAGVVASDHLADPLEDGSAALWLARPVGRATFALARFAGVLGICAVTGGALLGGSAALLHARHGLDVAPAAWAALACGLGVATTAALAMTASLHLPRIVTVLLVLVGIAAIAGVNAIALAGGELGGVAWALDRFGPPLGAAVAAPLAPWIAPTGMAAEPASLWLRSVAWAVGSASLLVVVFRRRDVPT